MSYNPHSSNPVPEETLPDSIRRFREIGATRLIALGDEISQYDDEESKRKKGGFRGERPDGVQGQRPWSSRPTPQPP
ncbi:hypothetical protein BC629DRAFT_1045635 [Irpex lacteus]|nr:hypothetical protein BC629DRAFT_1045635 [Irpex lacteus]